MQKDISSGPYSISLVPPGTRLVPSVENKLSSNYLGEATARRTLHILEDQPTLIPEGRRKKPRLRVYIDGNCEYQFAPNGWMPFENLQKAYRFLRKLSVQKTVFNVHW